MDETVIPRKGGSWNYVRVKDAFRVFVPDFNIQNKPGFSKKETKRCNRQQVGSIDHSRWHRHGGT